MAKYSYRHLPQDIKPEERCGAPRRISLLVLCPNKTGDKNFLGFIAVATCIRANLNPKEDGGALCRHPLWDLDIKKRKAL